MSIAPRMAAGKPNMPIRFKPNRREGLIIQFWLKDSGQSLVGIGNRLGILPPTVFNVIFGRRRSARVEAEIARLLGKTDWNEVVLDARSATTGKSVETILAEQTRLQEERYKSSGARFGAAMSAGKTRRAG